jgi:serine/threonine-protein kinase
MTDPSSLIGTKLESYEIQALIGSGGMASVYRGFDHDLQRQVAIKILSNQVAASQPDLSARFRQEARMIARLRHPNVVQVYDFGEEAGLSYMIEELLPGPTLGRQLRELAAGGERLAREQVLTITSHLASALDAAHAVGIIHRDIKPENAIWNSEGMLVLTDFGIARQMLADVKHTQTGMIIGTPHYLSPEQAQGLALTPASDIYALGVVLYQMLAGQVPFSSDTPMKVALDHIHTPPPSLLPLRSDLPPAVDQVVQRALAKQPEQRFASANELAQALEHAWTAAPPPQPPAGVDLHNQSTQVWQSAPQPAPPDVRPQPMPVPTAKHPQPTSTPDHPAVATTRGRPPWLLLLGGLLALLLLGGLLLALGGRAAQQPAVLPDPTTPLVPSATTAAEATAVPEATTVPEATAVPETAASPAPDVPVPTGQMVFTSQRDGDWDIYAMNADGSNLRNLTNNNVDDFAPAWSPDGRTVAFHSYLDGDEEVYVMDADGSNLRKLTNNFVNDREPTWSPDGWQIAFWSDSNGTWDIFVMNADGSERRRLTTAFADDFDPHWSPDGQSIVFASNRSGNDDIYMVNVATGAEQQLTEHPANDRYPAWSPDGEQIVFMSERTGNGEIYLMNADGRNQRNLTEHPTWDTQPHWSPDGRFIAFTANRDDNDEIYVMDADGRNPRRLTNSPASDWDAVWVR